MVKSTDLTGFKVGKLTVIELAYKKQNFYPNGKKGGWRYYYRCLCECGKETIVLKQSLTKQNPTISCGCLIGHNGLKHGGTGTRLYGVYRKMKQRCLSPKNKSYKNYGGRGITICKEWLEDYTNFYNWAIANGYNEKAPYMECTIDRIDVNGNYEPSNCRWITNKEQQQNTRRNNFITYKGKEYTITDLANILGTCRNTILYHQRQGTLQEYFAEMNRRNKEL